MFVLILLKKKLEGSIIDKILRYSSNIFSKFYYNFSKKYDISKKPNFIFICYGGLGDYILTFQFLNQLSLKYHLTVFIDERFKEISCLLNEQIKILNYSKLKLLKSLSAYGKHKKNNNILIQQSPILEFMLFHFSLGRPPIIGYIHSQNLISSKGITLEKKYSHSKNKIIKYNNLLKQIFLIDSKTKNIQEKYANTKLQKLSCKFIPQEKYFILSPTKNYKWEMGFLDPRVYAEFIVYIYKKRRNH